MSAMPFAQMFRRSKTEIRPVRPTVLLSFTIRFGTSFGKAIIHFLFSNCKLFNFQGYHALQAYRIAHTLWTRGQKILALSLQSRISEVFAVDIHPGKLSLSILLTHKPLTSIFFPPPSCPYRIWHSFGSCNWPGDRRDSNR